MQLITKASADKLRGGFYTPEPIADFVLQWALADRPAAAILEPSCGDGVFLRRLRAGHWPYAHVTAVEFDPVEAAKANALDVPDAEIINADFHAFCNHTPRRYDVVVGNPPYIRYQYFDPRQQLEAQDLFIRAGLHYSKLTNAWVSFVIGASLLLTDEGRLGLVVPAELLQVSYAKQLRAFLAGYFNRVTLISFEKLVFPGIQQEVVLLLCERDGSRQHTINHFEVADAAGLRVLTPAQLRTPGKRLDFRAGKWTHYFLTQEEIDLLEAAAQHHAVPALGRYATVEVGITTGANSFFTVPRAIVEEFDLHPFVRPMVGRSVQVESLRFTTADWQRNCGNAARAHLLVFPGQEVLAHAGARAYIEAGEAEGLHKGYKCGIRDDWFAVASLKVSEALFIRRNNAFPKLVLNEARAYTTDTMHRVFLKPGTDSAAFAASFYNSLSLAGAEIAGRSYGGGVLELMPSEAAQIALPYRPQHAALLPRLDAWFRAKTPIQTILKTTDAVLLCQGYGFSERETAVANAIWVKLSARRLNRNK